MNTDHLITRDVGGPWHDFLLLKEGERSYQDYWDLFHDPRSIRLSDDLYQYIYESLTWIPTLNPGHLEIDYGLHTHGPTIINKVGAQVFQRVFAAWAALFSNAPEQILLKSQEVAETRNNGDYEYEVHYWYEVERDPFLRLLNTLAEYGEKAQTGEYYILHLGV